MSDDLDRQPDVEPALLADVERQLLTAARLLRRAAAFLDGFSDVCFRVSMATDTLAERARDEALRLARAAFRA